MDLAFEVCRKHGIRLNIIGQSPYLESIKPLAPPQAVFYGQLNDKEKIKDILSRCFCGYAIYRRTGPQSYSYYGFPSKSLYYFANNIPLLATDTSLFTQEVGKLGIGRVVEPTLEQIEKAVLDLKKGFPVYYETINRFRETWNAGVEKFHRERLSALLKDRPE